MFAYPEEVVFSFLDQVIRIHHESSKPIAVVIHNLPNGRVWQKAYNCQEKCHQAGVPVYFSVHSAAIAISRFLRYHENRAELAG
jgi:acyl-CoA synthetase (NDP forming)